MRRALRCLYRRGRRVDCAGLTFVELLMAATIGAILMVGLATHVHGGITAWRRTVSAVDDLERLHEALACLTRDLANAVIVDPQPGATPQAVFGGHALAFCTIPSASDAAAAGPRWVTYHVGEQEGGAAVLRSVCPLQEARAGAMTTPQVLLPHVARWTLRYGYRDAHAAGVVWRPQWTAIQRVPQLVEVTFEFSRPVAQVSTLRHLVLAPGGLLASTDDAP